MIPAAPVGKDPNDPTCKRRILKRYEALKTERSAWVVVWKQLAEYILPRRFRDTPSLWNKPAPNEKLGFGLPASPFLVNIWITPPMASAP